MSDDRPTTTLLFAIALPNDFDPEDVDPEQVADEFVAMLNERRRLNWPAKWPDAELFVSGIPAAQWLRPSTMTALRAAAAEGPWPDNGPWSSTVSGETS